jgi:hypothetical protein
MKIARWFSLAGGMLCVLLGHSGSIARSQTADQPACIVWPPKYGSFETMANLRTRAWKLFSTLALTTRPIFDSPDWVPKQRTFLQESTLKTKAKGLTVFFSQELIPDGPYSDKAAPPPAIPQQPLTYESVFFNRIAYRHIRTKELYASATTKKLQIVENRRDIPEFPSGSRVVKTFWRPVPDGGSVNVGVWKWNLVPTTAVWWYETKWSHQPVCVEVNPSSDSHCLKASDYFYTTKTTQKNGPGFSCIVANPDLSCPALPPGQTLILIGVHLASKEKPDWFWATFWWQGVHRQDGSSPQTASWTCDNAQRPPELATGVWSNYSMDVRTSFEDPKPQVDAKDIANCGSPPIIGRNEQLQATYNPFVEGVKLKGRKSSCIDCHSRADTNINPDVSIPQECPPPGPLQDKPTLEQFEGHIRTDYLWSITQFLAHTSSKK